MVPFVVVIEVVYQSFCPHGSAAILGGVTKGVVTKSITPIYQANMCPRVDSNNMDWYKDQIHRHETAAVIHV